MAIDLHIRDVRQAEFGDLGRLMVDAYSGLAGFPTRDEQPGYYEMLAKVGAFSMRKGTRVLVAIAAGEELAGGVVYFSDMAQYGSGGSATLLRDASGIRLLAVHSRFRSAGVGKALTQACIELARQAGHAQVILHTTQAMQVAWKLYENLGFVRSDDLDFSQLGLPVFGFRLALAAKPCP
jgi:GNAT superfamily N-acetyltransferase